MKRRRVKHPDVMVDDLGTVVRFEPMNARAKRWIKRHCCYEPWQVHGFILSVEHRFAWDIIKEMKLARIAVVLRTICRAML